MLHRNGSVNKVSKIQERGRERYHEDIEGEKVLPAYALGKPWTVVVKALNADITPLAMIHLAWLKDPADLAVPALHTHLPYFRLVVLVAVVKSRVA